MYKFKVYDQFGGFLRAFRTWDEANKFRIVKQRPDWEIRLDNSIIMNMIIDRKFIN